MRKLTPNLTLIPAVIESVTDTVQLFSKVLEYLKTLVIVDGELFSKMSVLITLTFEDPNYIKSNTLIV